MPILGESKEYYAEKAALHNGVRRKRPLERKATGQRAALLVFWLAVLVIVLLFALFWTQPGLVQY